jgi:hypothetical protein
MKTQMNDRTNGMQQTKLSLQQLVTRLLVHFQPAAVRQKSFILNDVPDNFWVNTDENMLSSVISSLFSTVISRSESGCIRISAKTYNNIVVVNVQDNNNAGNIRVPQELEEAQPLAERLGGCITMNNQRSDATMVTFSFFSPSIAA